MKVALVADIGNTESHLGVYRAGKRIAQWRFATDDAATADRWAAYLYPLFALKKLGFGDIAKVTTASVRDMAFIGFREFCVGYLKIDPIQLDSESMDDFIKTDLDPGVVAGADRLVNAWWAYKRHRRSAIVVDLGTATNFDVVSDAGVYLGGLIMTGMEVSSEALFRRASKLTRVTFVSAPPVVGKNTVAAVRAGLYWGHIGMIEGIVKRIEQTEIFDQPPVLIATGGLSAKLKNGPDIFHEIDPSFTLDGIAALAELIGPQDAGRRRKV